MHDSDCIDFLRWALPRLGFRYGGFRKVRRQVCKRIGRRIDGLGLSGPVAYRAYLMSTPKEWELLDGLCRITISRFYRDKGTFDYLGQRIFSDLAVAAVKRRGIISCWSAGCASGEEPYTLSILWHRATFPAAKDVDLRIMATDTDPRLLDRAARACYPAGTLKDVPVSWFGDALVKVGREWCVCPDYRTGVRFRREDIRQVMPSGPLDLVLCRNLAFTYFNTPLQRRVLQGISTRLRLGGYLVIGRHETLPENGAGLASLSDHREIYRKEVA
jgi:chemotaxis protein methyltransferase CheR